jgi:hypothetical protein
MLLMDTSAIAKTTFLENNVNLNIISVSRIHALEVQHVLACWEVFHVYVLLSILEHCVIN